MRITIRQENYLARLLLGGAGFFLIALGFAALTTGWANTMLLAILSINPEAPPTPDWQHNLLIFGRDMLFRGVLLWVVLIWLIMPGKEAITARIKHPFLLILIAMGGLLLLWVPVMIFGYSTIIGNTRYWWLFDDAMISMRYAHNLVKGYGLVWNPGEYVEGYTNFLWVIYMALVHLLPIPISQTAFVVALTNMLLSLAIIPLLLKILHMMESQLLAQIGVLASYLLSLNVMGWSTAGAETVLLSFLFLLAIFFILRDAHHQQTTFSAYGIASLISLVRSDALVLTGTLYMFAWFFSNNKSRVVWYVTISMLIPIAHMAFRLFYYGDIIPNTAHLKVTKWDNRYAHGIAYVENFITTYFLPFVLALIGVWISRSRTVLVLTGIVLVYMAYVAYAGGDGFEQFRFLVPILPLLYILAFLGIEKLPLHQPSHLLLSGLCMVSLPLIIPGDTTPLYPRHMAIGNIQLGLLYKENVPPSKKVADFWAGLVFYYSDVTGIDLLGKNDPYIARIPARYGDVPGHNKFDFDYSLSHLKPDYVNSSFLLPVNEEELHKYATSEAPWRGELYFNETFRKHCLPYPVEIPSWRAVFTCDWSPEMERRRSWVVPHGGLSVLP